MQMKIFFLQKSLKYHKYNYYLKKNTGKIDTP